MAAACAGNHRIQQNCDRGITGRSAATFAMFMASSGGHTGLDWSDFVPLHSKYILRLSLIFISLVQRIQPAPMLQALVITLREGLEAFLIVAISLAYLRQSGRDALVSAVRWGIVAALA